MKKKHVNVPLSEADRKQLESTRDEIEAVIEMSDYLKNAFFWSGDNGNASYRRRREAQLEASASWTESGKRFYAHIWVSQSRHNTYVYRNYRADGVSTNLNAIRGSLRRIIAMLDADDEFKASL